MEDRPSFRRRRDVLRLLLALALPWALLGLAYSAPLLQRALYRAGHDTSWMMGDATYVWFYGFGFPALFSLPVLILFGVYRLVRRPEYRRSWYGWSWPVLMWLDGCGLGVLMDSGILPK